jgi:hypothetical protein
MNKTNAMRIAFRNIAKAADGRNSVYSVRDLANACLRLGVRKGASAEAFTLAALSLLDVWHNPPTLCIGDVVCADYFGTVVVGRIRSFDVSGYVYLDAIAPGSCDHDGRKYDGVALAPHQRKRMFKIGRKPFASIGTDVYGDVYGRATA